MFLFLCEADLPVSEQGNQGGDDIDRFTNDTTHTEDRQQQIVNHPQRGNNKQLSEPDQFSILSRHGTGSPGLSDKYRQNEVPFFTGENQKDNTERQQHPQKYRQYPL